MLKSPASGNTPCTSKIQSSAVVAANDEVKHAPANRMRVRRLGIPPTRGRGGNGVTLGFAHNAIDDTGCIIHSWRSLESATRELVASLRRRCFAADTRARA